MNAPIIPIPDEPGSIDLPEHLADAVYDTMFEAARFLSGDGHPPTITQRNFYSTFRSWWEYERQWFEAPLPTRESLERWRDAMARGELAKQNGELFAVGSINARLTHMRRLVHKMRAYIHNPALLITLREWAEVKNVPPRKVSDAIEEDYGIRLRLHELERYIQTPDRRTLLGLRDRAILSLGAGAGLRVSEIHRLNIKDALHETEDGKKAVLVRQGKGNKQRLVVLGGWNSWVIRTLQDYWERAAVDSDEEPAIRGVIHRRDDYIDNRERLSPQNIAEAVKRYEAVYRGKAVTLSPHDLRRTYALLCRRPRKGEIGMSYDALAANLGHESVRTTELYVGREVDLSDRMPDWDIDPGEVP